MGIELHLPQGTIKFEVATSLATTEENINKRWRVERKNTKKLRSSWGISGQMWRECNGKRGAAVPQYWQISEVNG
jgi:hypothetical protein